MMSDISTLINFDTALQGMSIPELVNYLNSHVEKHSLRNEITGEKINNEDSPGNFTVFEDERGKVVRIYEKSGAPLDKIIPGKPSDSSNDSEESNSD